MKSDENPSLFSEHLKQLSIHTQQPIICPDYPLSLKLRGHLVCDAAGNILFVDKLLSEVVRWLSDNGYEGAIITDDDGQKAVAVLVTQEIYQHSHLLQYASLRR